MGNLAAVTGVGMTSRFSAKVKESIAGLVREAAIKALEDAGCTWDDIDAVILGKAPDFFRRSFDA